MGTWDDGLYDSDDALDTHSDLLEQVEEQLETSPAHFIAGLGLIAWMAASRLECDPDDFRELIDRHRSWVDDAPPAARERVLAIYEDPESFGRRNGSRGEEITAVVGGYCDGPREDALLSVPGADALIADLAERCRAALDGMATEVEESPDDLYERSGQLAALGLLVELTTLGVHTPRERVARWRAAFESVNENTPDERDFFDGFAARVRKGFELLERGQ